MSGRNGGWVSGGGGLGGLSEVDFENQHYRGAHTHRAVPLLNAVHLARQPFSRLTAVSHLASPPATALSQQACVAFSALTRSRRTVTSFAFTGIKYCKTNTSYWYVLNIDY